MGTSTLKAALATALLCTSATAYQAAAADLTFGSPLPPGHILEKHGLQPAFDSIRDKVDIEIISGAQLFSVNEALPSVGGGIADMTSVVPVYSASTLPHAAIPFNMLMLVSNELAAAGAAAELYALDCPACMKDYKDAGAVFLANYAIGGYSLLCNSVVDSTEAIEGKRIRAVGSMARWAETLGGTPVSMTVGDMVEGIQRGQVDCIMGFTSWYESYPFGGSVESIYNYNIGVTGAVGLVVMNSGAWSDLSSEQRQALWNAMPQAIAGAMIPGYIAQDISVRKNAEEAGIQFFDGEDAVRPIWEGYRTDEMKAVIGGAEQLGAQNPQQIADRYLELYEKWLGLIEEAGLAEVRAGGEMLSDEQLAEAEKTYADLLNEHVYSKVDPESL